MVSRSGVVAKSHKVGFREIVVKVEFSFGWNPFIVQSKTEWPRVSTIALGLTAVGSLGRLDSFFVQRAISHPGLSTRKPPKNLLNPHFASSPAFDTFAVLILKK
jgi:hypothetical protein